MGLDYSDTRVVKILMIKYPQNFLDEFPEEFRGTSATPVVDHLFQVIEEDEVDFL